MKVACVLITHLRAKVEMRRQTHLQDRAVLIVDRPRGRPLVVDHFPAASGIVAGMTLEQALSRQTDGAVMEADEAAYRREFHRVLVSLQGVSDRVEAAEIGAAYVGLDGLEALYGGEAHLAAALLNAVPQRLAPRLGVGEGKFPAFAAAHAARPLGAVRVPPDAAGFLAPHPVRLLPIPPGVTEEMRQFGIHTLGDAAAMEQEEITGRFGPAGRTAWELSIGLDRRPLAPMRQEEVLTEWTSMPFASASLELLGAAVDAPAEKSLRPAPDAGAATPEAQRWNASCSGRRPGRRNSTSSSPQAAGNRHPASSGANWKRTTPRPRWRR